MHKRTGAGRGILAIGALTSVGLLAGCGADRGASGESVNTALSSATAALGKTTPNSSEASPTPNVQDQPTGPTSAPDQTVQPETQVPGAQDAQTPGLQSVQPAQNEVKPLDVGRPGSPEEVAGITTMLRRAEQQTTVRGYMENVVNSMCSDLIEKNGGRDAFGLNEFPNLQLKDLPEYQSTRTTVTGVDHVLVNGDEASAEVTSARATGESDTSTMRFKNEQGEWKLCS